MSKVEKPFKARNFLARHPLMKKGGIHEKTKKAERKAAKQRLRREYPGERVGTVTDSTISSGYLGDIPVSIELH